MISEGSCDTENLSNDAKFSFVLKASAKCINVNVNSYFNISQYYSFYCIFDQINAALVSDDFCKH